MAHYDEQYEEREKRDAERRKEYKDARNKLMGLPQNQMIEMLFSAYLDSLTPQQLVNLSKCGTPTITYL